MLFTSCVGKTIALHQSSGQKFAKYIDVSKRFSTALHSLHGSLVHDGSPVLIPNCMSVAATPVRERSTALAGSGVLVLPSHARDSIASPNVLLFGQLRIYFATVGTVYSATVRFDTVGEELYRDAIDLILKSVEQTHPLAVKNDCSDASTFEAWPMKIRTEADRYRPKDQPLLAAIHWPAISGGFQRALAPAGALLVTEREVVLISEEKQSPRQHEKDLYQFGGNHHLFPSFSAGRFSRGPYRRDWRRFSNRPDTYLAPDHIDPARKIRLQLLF